MTSTVTRLGSLTDGTGEARFVSDRYGVADVLGRAVIVHANPDNYANVPTRYAAGGPDATTLARGNAGGRIACGVIETGRGLAGVPSTLRPPQ